MYNYVESMKEDIKEYLRRTKERDFNKLYEEMFLSDEITGKDSGTYTFSDSIAEKNLLHNNDLLQEALIELDYTHVNLFNKSAEWCDVMIRSYLLSQVLSQVLHEIKD